MLYSSLLLSSLWNGTIPECHSWHNVAHVEHGQTG